MKTEHLVSVMATTNKEQAIKDIAQANYERCNIPQVLDALEITVGTVPSLNLYIFELIQNAIDAGANSVAIRMEADANNIFKKFILEHNGPGGFTDDPAHVKGLSNVFQSTKSIGSVGFMGFGFKTIYKRFQTVTVSDTCGWRFKFTVKENAINVASDVQVFSRDWLGAVSPTWDSTIAPPTAPEFTTRFEMYDVTSTFSNTPVEKDLDDAFFQDGSCTVMAILATQGLKRISIQRYSEATPRVWQLSAMDKTVSVDDLRWDAFTAEFKPSTDALQCLCQARLKNIIATGGASEVWSKLSGRTHRVVGLVQCQSGGSSRTPITIQQGGQIFATLPVQSRLALGMAVQAEWLLDLSRSGLRDVDTNAWQQSIIDKLCDVISNFCAAIPTEYSGSRASVRAAFDVLRPANSASIQGPLSLQDQKWLQLLSTRLDGVRFLPILSDGDNSEVKFCTPGKVFVLPKARNVALPLGSSHLLKKDLLDRELVGDAALAFLISIGIVKPLSLEDLLLEWEQEHGLENWWSYISSLSHLSAEKKWDTLFDLWSFIADVSAGLTADGKGDVARRVSASLPCVPSASGSWVSPRDILVFEHNNRLVSVPLESAVPCDSAAGLACRYLNVPLSRRPREDMYQYLIRQADADWGGSARRSVDWISKLWTKSSFADYTRDRALTLQKNEIDEQGAREVVGFLQWSAQNNLQGAITHLLTSNGSSYSLRPCQECVVAEPFVEDSALAKARRAIFPSSPVVAKEYVTLGAKHDTFTTVTELRQLFEQLGALGPVRFSEVEKERLSVWPSYSEVKQLIADKLEISADKMKDVETHSKKGWVIFDVIFKLEADLHNNKAAAHLRAWLESSIDTLQKTDSAAYVQGEVWRIYRADGRVGTASWARQLASIAWVPSRTRNGLFKPSELATNDSNLSVSLVSVLESKGLVFARSEPSSIHHEPSPVQLAQFQQILSICGAKKQMCLRFVVDHVAADVVCEEETCTVRLDALSSLPAAALIVQKISDHIATSKHTAATAAILLWQLFQGTSEMFDSIVSGIQK